MRDAGAEIFSLDFVQDMVAPVHDARAVAGLRRVLRDRRWDVVHTHGNKGGLFGRPLARLRGLPVAHSPHGFSYVTQHLRDRRGRGARRFLTRSIERALAPVTTMFVFSSERERDNAINDGIATPDRATVVRYGVPRPPDTQADPELPHLDGDGPLIGYVARLSPEKDPLLFVSALEVLRKDGVDFRAVVVGDGPLDADVRARVAAAGLGARVAVVPFDPIGHTVYRVLDIFVLPSRWDMLPIANLEAMAAGVPIVARDVGSVSEAVRDGENGLLVREHTAQAVASALKRLITDAPLRQQLGDRGRQLHAELFDIERMVDQIEATYARMLQSSR